MKELYLSKPKMTAKYSSVKIKNYSQQQKIKVSKGKLNQNELTGKCEYLLLINNYE